MKAYTKQNLLAMKAPHDSFGDLLEEMSTVVSLEVQKIVSYLVGVVKAVIHESGDQRGLPHWKKKKHRQRLDDSRHIQICISDVTLLLHHRFDRC